MGQLVEELTSLSDWHTLGILLGVHVGKLKQIHADFSGHGVVRCRSELLTHWLNNSDNAYWETLASALKKMEEENLAKEILRKHGTSTVVQEPGMKGTL